MKERRHRQPGGSSWKNRANADKRANYQLTPIPACSAALRIPENTPREWRLFVAKWPPGAFIPRAGRRANGIGCCNTAPAGMKRLLVRPSAKTEPVGSPAEPGVPTRTQGANNRPDLKARTDSRRRCRMRDLELRRTEIRNKPPGGISHRGGLRFPPGHREPAIPPPELHIGAAAASAQPRTDLTRRAKQSVELEGRSALEIEAVLSAAYASNSISGTCRPGVPCIGKDCAGQPEPRR